MSFNPLEQKGMPLERQLRNWSELNVQPYDKCNVDAYTRCRVITLSAIEVEAALFSHQFARHTMDMSLKRQLAEVRRIEQQQQKAIHWLIPGDESPLERTIGYEQVAVDLTSHLARTEPDLYIKQIFDFGLLEDFDHLYRYADLLDLLEGKKAEKLVQDLTEIAPGRPTVFEHRHPYDDVRLPMNTKTANPLSALHVLTLVAVKQQTMNFYMNVGNMLENPLARGLYLEIAQIEEQHVSQYESLMDPRCTWLEDLVKHEYNEVYLYYSFMSQEPDFRIRQLFELHLDMELCHLSLACEALMKYENRDPAEFLPKTLPDPVLFQPNKQYVRDVLATQTDFTADGPELMPVSDLPKEHRYFAYQQLVNVGGWVPSEVVIEEEMQANNRDYRLETEGPHPVDWLREPVFRGRKRHRQANGVGNIRSLYELVPTSI